MCWIVGKPCAHSRGETSLAKIRGRGHGDAVDMPDNVSTAIVGRGNMVLCDNMLAGLASQECITMSIILYKILRELGFPAQLRQRHITFSLRDCCYNLYVG